MSENRMPQLLVQSIREFKTDGFYFDVDIKVEGQIFKAHKMVLAAYSPYFHSLFSGYFKENGSNTIHILGGPVTIKSFNVILDFVYGHQADLNDENIIEVSEAAQFCMMQELEMECEEYLLEAISLRNIKTFIEDGICRRLPIVLKATANYYKMNPKSTRQCKVFSQLSLPTLSEYLSESVVHDLSEEMDLHLAAMSWLKENHDENGSKAHVIDELMGHIDYKKLTSAQLLQVQSDFGNIPMLSYARKFLNDCEMLLQYIAMDKHEAYDPEFAWCINEVDGTLTKVYDFKNDQLLSEPNHVDDIHTLEITRNFLFQYCGTLYSIPNNLFSKQEIGLNIDSIPFKCLDFNAGEILSIPPHETYTKYKTNIHCLAFGIYDTVYIVSSARHFPEEKSTVACYNIHERRWQDLHNAPFCAVKTPACCSHNDVFVFGSTFQQRFWSVAEEYIFNGIYKYNPIDDSWTESGRFQTRFCGRRKKVECHVFLYDGKFYKEQRPMGSTIEIYDIETKTSTISEMSYFPFYNYERQFLVASKGSVYSFHSQNHLYQILNLESMKVINPPSDVFSNKKKQFFVS